MINWWGKRDPSLHDLDVAVRLLCAVPSLCYVKAARQLKQAIHSQTGPPCAFAAILIHTAQR